MITIEQLQGQLQSINTSLKNGGISAALQNELISNQILLQGWINQLVAGRSLSDQDIQSMEQTLDTSKKKTLEAQSERTKKVVKVAGIGLIVIIIGGIIFFYIKQKK